MDERLRFGARLLEGEKMAPLCAQFGISRKTTVTRCGRADSNQSTTPFGPKVLPMSPE